MHKFCFFSQDIIVLLVPWFGFHFLQILFIWYRRSMLCFLIKPLVNKFSSWVTTDCNFRFFLKKKMDLDIFILMSFLNNICQWSFQGVSILCVTLTVLLHFVFYYSWTWLTHKHWSRTRRDYSKKIHHSVYLWSI